MRKLLILFIGMFLISLVSAQQSSLGTFKQGEDINLIQTCADCTCNNITAILSPNGTVIVSNVEMDKDGSYFNYTLDSNFTQALGTYQVNGIGDDEGIDTIWVYSFEVTPSGTSFTNALSIPLFLPMVLMLLITFSFFVLTGFTETREYKFTFLIFGGLFLILAIVFGIMASREVLYGFPMLYNFINSFSRIFIITLQVVAIVIPIIVMFLAIKRAFDTRGYNLK